MERGNVGITTLELPLVARGGKVYVFDPRPWGDGEIDARRRSAAPRVVILEAAEGVEGDELASDANRHAPWIC
eukprot:2299052-Alexandrium_andersonii.AAC.1